MKGIYLAAGRSYHENYDITYQDIDGSRDLSGDMMNIDLAAYDYIIASPPCNYWSKARGNRLSEYSIKTKKLLPEILLKLQNLNKPYIVENVKNIKRMKSEGIFELYNGFIYFIGRHTYFTNIYFDDNYINQRQDFKQHGNLIQYDKKDWYRQGGYNVHNVIERWLYIIHKYK